MKVIDATYLKDYKVELLFDDKKKQLIDFLPVLQSNPVCKKYLDLLEFKKFKIEDGNIVWGKKHSPLGHENQCNVCTPGNVFNFYSGQIFLSCRHGIFEHAFCCGQILVLGHVRTTEFFM